MSKIELSEKNKLRLQQLYLEKQKIEYLIENTIMIIIDSSNVDHEKEDQIILDENFNFIEIKKNKKDI